MQYGFMTRRGVRRRGFERCVSRGKRVRISECGRPIWGVEGERERKPKDHHREMRVAGGEKKLGIRLCKRRQLERLVSAETSRFLPQLRGRKERENKKERTLDGGRGGCKKKYRKGRRGDPCFYRAQSQNLETEIR